MKKYIGREFHPDILLSGKDNTEFSIEQLTLEIEGDCIYGIFDVKPCPVVSMVKNLELIEPSLKRIVSKLIKTDLTKDSFMFCVKNGSEIRFTLYADDDRYQEIIEKNF